MEYTYRSSFSDESCTVILTETHLIWQEARTEIGIPYLDIAEVQIDRGPDIYKTRLLTEKGNSFVISNRNYRTETQFEDQSRAYATFIRVLHFHLKDKSRAVYTSGKQPVKIGAALSISIVVSFVLSFLADYFGIRFLDPFLEGLCLAGLAAAAILVANFNHWPRHYPPSDIPLEFLP